MSYGEMILPEYDMEFATTRRILERIPNDKLGWKAHEKSNTLGWNANHLAEIPGWTAGTLASPSWDLAPVDGDPYESPTLGSMEEILELFDQNVAEGRAALETATHEQMSEMWSLLRGGEAMFTIPRAGVIRTFVINHSIHHRGIVTVYLRLNDIAVPSVYGPSGDESGPNG